MSQSLYSRYVSARADHPQLYARDLAALLETSEAQLAAARVGHDARRLADEPKALLGALASVGELKAITRNDWAVHEQVGHYVNQQLDGHAGLILNPGGIDLRLFLKQWHSAFVLEESSSRGVRHSLQFFDAQGDAIHKVYTTENSDMTAWQQLIAQFARQDNPELDVVAAQKQAFATEVDSAQLEAEWRGMTDVHQFYMILHRHRLSRQQAFNSVSDDLARRVDNQTVEALLNRVQQDGNSIMVFVANRGAVQIFTGPLVRVEPMRGWLNIFNPEFTLHLRDSEIAESWITRKPTVDGVVTSLELYDAHGNQIAQLYGERKEGQPEQALWREQLAELEESEVTV